MVFAIHWHKISHMYTRVPYPEPPSHFPSHPIPLGCPSVLALSALFHALNLDWSSISHMVIYMFQCCSLKSCHPRLLPQSPKVCSLYLCLFCCLAYRVIVTIFLNSIYMCFFFCFFFLFYFFNFKIFNSYMRSQTWTPLPPPSPLHLSGSSPCTSPKHAVSCVRHRLAIQFLHDSIHVRMPFSQIIPPSLAQDTACLGLVHGDDPERCYGEGGGRGVHVWERM